MAPVAGPTTAVATVVCVLASFGTWRYNVQPVPQATTIEGPLAKREIETLTSTTVLTDDRSVEETALGSDMGLHAKAGEESGSLDVEPTENVHSEPNVKSGVIDNTPATAEDTSGKVELAVDGKEDSSSNAEPAVDAKEAAPTTAEAAMDVREESTSDAERHVEYKAAVVVAPVNQLPELSVDIEVNETELLAHPVEQIYTALEKEVGHDAEAWRRIDEWVKQLPPKAQEMFALLPIEDWVKHLSPKAEEILALLPWKVEHIMGFAVCLDVAFFVISIYLCRCCRRKQAQPENDDEERSEDEACQESEHDASNGIVQEPAPLEDVAEEKDDEDERVKNNLSPTLSSSSEAAVSNVPTPTRNTGPKKGIRKSDEEVRQRMAQLKAECEVLDERPGTDDSKPTTPTRETVDQRAVPKKAPNKSWAEIQGRMNQLQKSCEVFSEADDGRVTTHLDDRALAASSDTIKGPDAAVRRSTKSDAEVRAKMAARKAQCEVLGEGVGLVDKSGSAAGTIVPERTVEAQAEQDAKDLELHAMQELEAVRAEAA